MSYDTWYTKGGIAITIKELDSSIKDRMENHKLGQKVHRYTKENPHYYHVTISGERGSVEDYLGREEPIEDGVNAIVEKYLSNEATGQKRTPQTDIENHKKSEEEYYNKQRSEALSKQLKEFPSTVERYSDICSLLGISPDLSNLETDEDKAEFVSSFEGVTNLLRNYTYTSGWISTSDPGFSKVTDGFDQVLSYYKTIEAHPRYATLVEAIYQWILKLGKFNNFEMFANAYMLKRALENNKVVS